MKIASKNSPLVSIIMCTYNRQDLISESIQSCLDQTLESWELIIIDDHSTDDTEKVIGTFKDPRIKFVKSSYPKGRSNARNFGLKLSRGEYISFLDSDDLINPKKLETDVALLAKSENAGAVYSSAESVEIGTGKSLGYYHARHGGDLYDLTAYYLPLIIATSQVTIKRQIYQNIGGFDPELDRFEDTDFFRRVSLVSEWIPNPEVFVNLKNHADNTISNQSRETIFEMIERYVYKVNSEIGSNQIQTTATPTKLYLHYANAFFVQSGGIKASLKLYFSAIKDNPGVLPLCLVSILKMIKHRILNNDRIQK